MHRVTQIVKQVQSFASDEKSDVLWLPSELSKTDSNLAQFMDTVNRNFALNIVEYEDLHKWSVTFPEKFWGLLWSFVGVEEMFRGASLENRESMMDAVFFPECEFNFARNCLRGNSDSEAIVYSQEGSSRRSISWSALRLQVQNLSNQLRADGIVKGDRVAGIVSNTPEAVVCMLATTAVGAVWSSVSPDFGVEGIVERFGQISPKIIFYSNSYYIKRKRILNTNIDKLKTHLSCQQFVPIDNNALETYIKALRPRALTFEPTKFNDPAFIMFSSGTTGKPKCIVHRHGVLLQLMKEHQLHSDIKPGDRVFYYTTTTWMMWNWLCGVLASKATILLFEGSPFFPTSNVLFEYASTEEATFMGVSAKFIDSLKTSDKFRALPSIPTVRTIASTGSPLVAESFDFVYTSIKRDVNLASICGGTDILSCFILGCPIKPVKRGYVQCRGLGMDVQIWDDAGNSIIGNRGELVCTTPFVSMPIEFYGDTDNSVYKSAYFSEWPNVWKQGDYAMMDSAGHIIVLGRSDATLNPGGVRIGTAEIYRAVEALPFVSESVCCGIELKKGEESVALFVVLKDPYTVLSEDMKRMIKASIQQSATRHHVPSLIHQVMDIPKTQSGKIVELAVKNTANGRPVKNLNSIVNPQVLNQYTRSAWA